MAADSSAGPAVRQQRVDHRRQLLRARRSDTIVPSSLASAAQSTRGLLAALILVAAHERQRVAAAGIGHRNAGVGRRANRGRHAGHDLERNALLVQEQRFDAALIEDERVAPLEPGDQLAFARLLGDEVADGFLIEPLAARRCRRRSARRAGAANGAGADGPGGRR